MTKTPFQQFLESKGIREDTAALWGVEDHGDEAHFVYPEGRKIRGNIHGDARRTFRYEGKSSLYYRVRTGETRRTAFMVEGETDALVLDQALRDNGLEDRAVFGLSGVNGWKSEYTTLFEGVERILIILDNDEDYSVRATVDKAFAKMAHDLGRRRVRRIYLPSDVKDVCEFFANYSFESFKEIAKPSNKTYYEKLDLNATPPHFEWMVERMICQGDVALLAGPPGIGKSLLSQALSVALVEGHERFLGLKLKAHGPVMYVDKENPQDIIYDRLKWFGLTSRGRDHLHYYYRPDVYLDRSPEKLLDDAMIIKPALIVLDSMSSFHTKDEVSPNEMRQLFNEGIIPLSRDAGAAVIVLHHTTKAEGRSTFQNIRGSGDISAAADATLELVPTVATNGGGKDREAIRIVQGKTRRSSKGGLPWYFINTSPVGDVSLDVVEDGF